MRTIKKTNLAIMATVLFSALTGCMTTPKQTYDTTNLKHSDPHSILVLPPVNASLEVDASDGFYSQTTKPLSELGYYVFPIALVKQMFRDNGLSDPSDIQAVKLDKLNRIFGADAVLYLTVKQYGASYQVVQSDTKVTADAVLVDAKTGQKLWSGSATASSLEGRQNNNGLFGALVQAVVDQVSSSLSDKSHDIAGNTADRLFDPNKGFLPGARSNHYWRNGEQVTP